MHSRSNPLCIPACSHNKRHINTRSSTGCKYVNNRKSEAGFAHADAVHLAIDGPLASGKSTLANQFAADLGYACIHIDDFLEAGAGKCFAAIKLKKLKRKIASLPGPLIVEGACALKVMEALEIFPEYLIYLQDSIPGYKKQRDQFEKEVSQYLEAYSPAPKADLILRSFKMTTQHDVDIAYVKSRTLFFGSARLGRNHFNHCRRHIAEFRPPGR